MRSESNEFLDVEDDDLLELFAPRRPEPELFRQGVEDRIRDLESQAAEDAGAVPLQAEKPGPLRAEKPGLWRRVAAWLPLDSGAGLSAGTAGGAAVAKGAASQAAGGAAGTAAKSLPAALALPAALLAGILGAFALSTRALRRTSSESSVPVDRQELLEARRTLEKFNARLKTVGAVIMIASILVILPRPTLASDLVVAFLGLSMAFLVVQIKQLASQAQLARSQVAETVRLFFDGMLTVGTTSVILGSAANPSSDLDFGPSMLLILIGIETLHRWSRHGRWLRAVSLFAMVAVINVLGFTLSTPDWLRHQITQVELDPRDATGWEEAAAAHRALLAAGEETPDLRGAAEALARAVERRDHIPAKVLSGAADMDLVSPAVWSYAITQWRVASSPAPITDLSEVDLGDYATRYRARAILETQELNSADRDRLVSVASELWPAKGRHAALSRALNAATTLDALGRSDLVDEQRDFVHELLRSYQVTPSSANFLLHQSGGFTASPALVRTSMPSETLAAIELMERLGVPEGLDLREVRHFLRNWARAIPAFYDFQPEAKLQARAALLRLETSVEVPSRGWLAGLVAERFFIATLLLVVLGLLTVRWSPEETGPALGAEP